MENNENQRSVFYIAFETDMDENLMDSDSDICLNLRLESDSEFESFVFLVYN